MNKKKAGEHTLNWTPIRKGAIYCSPRCGARCTFKAFKKAMKDAIALKKKCEEEIGGDWIANVHENLGWHWSVIQKGTNIEIDYGGYLSNKGDFYSIGFAGGTPVQVSLHPQTFKTPKEAFAAQIKIIKKEEKRWTSITEAINRATKFYC